MKHNERARVRGRLGAPPQREFTAKTRDLRNEAQRASSGKRALLVDDRAPRAFKEQALGSRRAERASPEKADTASKQTQYQARGRVRVVHVAFLSVHEREVQKKNVVGPPELARCASYM